MATPEQVADFIDRRLTVGRVRPGNNQLNTWYFARWAPPYFGPPLPSIQQVANDLVADAEYTGLQLGGFLDTPSGEFLEQAVALVVPRVLSPEFGLIVAGLKLAAEIQQGKAWRKALLTIGGGILAGAIIKELGRAA